MKTIEDKEQLLTEIERVLKESIFSIIREKKEINSTTKFVEDLDFDSLDIVELILKMESDFDINISDEEAEKATTFGEAEEIIYKILSTH